MLEELGLLGSWFLEGGMLGVCAVTLVMCMEVVLLSMCLFHVLAATSPFLRPRVAAAGSTSPA